MLQRQWQRCQRTQACAFIMCESMWLLAARRCDCTLRNQRAQLRNKLHRSVITKSAAPASGGGLRHGVCALELIMLLADHTAERPQASEYRCTLERLLAGVFVWSPRTVARYHVRSARYLAPCSTLHANK